MHCSLYYSLLVLLSLCDDHHVLSAHPQPESISAILESYASAFTTGAPLPAFVSTPIYLNVEVSQPSTIVHDVVASTVGPEVAYTTSGYREPSLADSNVANSRYNSSEELHDVEEPPDHVIPFSEHEDPPEPATRPNYTAPGDWAKPPLGKDIELDFVPTKLYAQVRGSHTVKHVPREEAVQSAETAEEAEDAGRLREVLKVSKANTVYTEEGYEDAAYDHAGQVRDADFHEGFARKLKEDHEKRKLHDGDRPKSSRSKSKRSNKKNKNRKGRSKEKYDDDYIDHLEGVLGDEARVTKLQVKPENLRTLRRALKAPAVDAKLAAESGIYQLEQDLKKESREIVGTSTEINIVPTTHPPVARETTIPSKLEIPTTTEKRDVFTVRPRRLPTDKPRTIVAKIKTPINKYYPAANSRKLDSGETTTVNYSDLFWQYFLNKRNNQTPGELQAVTPVIANPLAVATVNGHGPYLLVVTAPPSTIPPGYLDGQSSETTVSYATAPTAVNGTRSPTKDNPFLHYESRKLDSLEHRGNYTKYSNISRKHEDSSEEKPKTKSSKDKTSGESKSGAKSPKTKPSNQQKLLNYVKSDKSSYRDYYTAMQPPKVSDVPIPYSDYSRLPYISNALLPQQQQLDIESPLLESVYDAMSEQQQQQRPREPLAAAQKSFLPVTRLLPPAPLYNSEYASFAMTGRREPVPQALMSIMPIIDVIRKRESQRRTFLPFLLRRKRSTEHGRSREWEIEHRDKKLREARLAQAGSERSEARPRERKPPRNFERLLNQSPGVAGRVVDEEIGKRFKSKEASQESSEEEYSGEASGEKSKEESGKADDVVEVDVPELDFSSIFENDEFEPTTRTPSIDNEKYPFYSDTDVFQNSPLKYIVNPAEVPRKTMGGMEFYDSRSLECEEIDPNLEKIVPEEEELAEKRGPRKSKPRLHGLGDKVDCYKAKYLGENPLDSPLFFEKTIENPTPPSELDPKKFASRILELPSENEGYVFQRGPKTPEDYSSTRRTALANKSSRQRPAEPPANYNYPPRSRRPGPPHPQQNRRPPSARLEEISAEASNRTRSKPKSQKTSQKIPPAYQRQVYEDVMGTIMNLENMYKTQGRNRKRIPSHSSHHNREHYDQQDNEDFDVPVNRRPLDIDGLVPPPKRDITFSPVHHVGKYGYSSQRNNRYALKERPTRHLRIIKRNVNSKEAEEVVITAKTPTAASDTTEKTPFRIIMTMPPPLEQHKKKRKTITILNDEPTTQRTIYTINDRLKSQQPDDLGKYDQFSYNSSSNSSVDARRNEPRYNVPEKQNPDIVELVTTTIPLNLEAPKVTSQASIDALYSRSTLVPVTVRPDEAFLNALTQETMNRYTKEKLDIPDNIDLQVPTNDYGDVASESTPNVKKAQYSVHEDTTDDRNADIATEFTMLPNSDEHRELYEFLQGNPPGYDKAFSGESTTEYEEVPLTVQRRAESKTYPKKIDSDTSDESDEPKEAYTEESSPDEVEEEPAEETQPARSDDETATTTTAKSSNESESEPFVRHADRPYSPPENYEDDRYSDLGPRVNKPYFYHPPFEIPEYEKRVLGKAVVDRADEEGWDRSAEETEDHERYVFPWENDEKEDEDGKGEESKDYSTMGYEFPWEKRERKERERKAKAKLHKDRYGVEYDYAEDAADDGDDDKEATNARPVVVPLKRKLSRGKKDVNNVEVSLDNRHPSKFSSKYKSGVVRIPFDDDEMAITVANTDKIKESVMSYLDKMDSSTPKTKSSKFSQKNVLNDTYSMSSTTSLPSKTSRKSDYDTKFDFAPPDFPFESTTKDVKIPSASSTPATVSTTTRTQARGRGSRRHVASTANVNDIARISSRTTDDQISRLTDGPISSTSPAARNVRRRGRVRDSVSSPSTTSSQPTTNSTPHVRRRGRPTTTTTTTTTTTSTSSSSSSTIPASAAPTSTSSRTVALERRRRPFRVAGTDRTTTPSSSTTLSSLPTSTGRTIEHHSRVSKEEIITKTSYQEDEDDEDEEEKKPLKYSKIRRPSRAKNESDGEPVALGTKKEKVEKVTITMEETPNHVFRTKEIDKDGVKGKFVTITPNSNNNNNNSNDNNSSGSSTPTATRRVDDAEVEEMKRRMSAFNSFDSVIRDGEDQAADDEPGGLRGAEKYLLENLLRKSPLPLLKLKKGNSTAATGQSAPAADRRMDDGEEDEEYDDDDDDEDDDNDDDDGDDDPEDEDDEDEVDDVDGKREKSEARPERADGAKEKSETKPVTESTTSAPVNATESDASAKIVKDPSSRKYFYVE